MIEIFCGAHGICPKDRQGCTPIRITCACACGNKCNCGCHESGHNLDKEHFNDLTGKWETYG